MNLSLLFVTCLICLTSQMPSIAGLKSERTALSDTKSILDGTKLILSLESGDAVIRRPRGSDNTQTPPDTPVVADENAAPKTGGSSGEKRSKNGGHGNKKLGRNQDVNAPIGGRNKHHMDKKPLSSGEQLQQQQQQHHEHTGKRQQLGGNRQQQHGNPKSNKQRQLLKSQQHQQEYQGHQGNKRNNGHKSKIENGGEHAGNDGGKMQSTCRYTKSAWSECDTRTNTHSRTLTLKRGDSNCLPTRTIQKKCKKVPACRYEKGTWLECKDGQMTRVDKLKTSIASSAVSTTDSSCEPTRLVNRKCNPDGNAGKSSKSHQNGNGKANKKERKNKDKANNRGTPQA